jgi:frataxin-like iron-binding protein CyaY
MNQSKFIILDLQGKKLKEVWLPLRQSGEWFQHSLTQWVRHDCSHPTFTIKNNTLYQLLIISPGTFLPR